MTAPLTIGAAHTPLPAQALQSEAPAELKDLPEEEDKRQASASRVIAESAKEMRSGTLAQSRLSIDHDAFVKAFVYRSIDTRTGEVIRQWPGEDALRLRRYLREFAGLVVDERA